MAELNQTPIDQTVPNHSSLIAEISPARVEPGSEVILTAAIAAADIPQGNIFVIIFDAEGNELGRGDLMESANGTCRSAPMVFVAPDLPGQHDWSVMIARAGEGGGEFLHSAAVPLVVAAHPIGLVVWDLPSAVTQGETFQLRIGVKCPCGCDSTGWGWSVSDSEGRQMALGTVGAHVWPGTTGLCYAEVALTAPRDLGSYSWTVEALAPDAQIAHAPRSKQIRVEVRPAADVILAIEALDATTGKPVERAKVTAHPYRAMTDAQGRASLSVPSGLFTIFVSGKGYAPLKRTLEIKCDMTLRAELHMAEEATHADNWG